MAAAAATNMRPTSNFLNAMLTDMYQITMCYAHWRGGRHTENSVFDYFFRKNPFQGEYTVFAGLSEVLAFLNTYHFTEEHIAFLRLQLVHAEDEFFEYLRSLNCSQVKVLAFQEGSIVFPREPLIRIEGPIGICQLLETTILSIINFASLVATNAARMRVAAGEDKALLEFGLRRAQGPDGAMSASRYTYVGGFDGTSNVLAGMLFGIKVGGTMAHSFVQSFTCLEELNTKEMPRADGSGAVDFVDIVLRYRDRLNANHTNVGELTAFISYCQAFPESFLALVDTYDTLVSGVPNFLACALAMAELGHKPLGIRLDSGDLAYLSLEARSMFAAAQKEFGLLPSDLRIVASNDIGEATLYALNQQGHSIDTFGIGTAVVTCEGQPALGCVCKLVAFQGRPRIKLSQEAKKVSIPGRKMAFRLLGRTGTPLVDLLTLDGELCPRPGDKVMCRHPMDPTKRVLVTATTVQRLLEPVWDGHPIGPFPTIGEVRQRVLEGLRILRHDHVRFLNPTPYKVSVSDELYSTMYDLWRTEAPIAELE